MSLKVRNPRSEPLARQNVRSAPLFSSPFAKTGEKWRVDAGLSQSQPSDGHTFRPDSSTLNRSYA